MDRRQLEAFRAVADAGSVSAAAKTLLLTQPAISKQISRLEATLRLRLFHRNSAGMSLTAAGEALYEMGDDLLNRFERLEETMDARFSRRASWRVACPHTTAAVLLTPFMAEKDPLIADLVISQASKIDQALEREADLGVGTVRPPLHRQQLVVAPLIIWVQGTPQLMNQYFSGQSRADLSLLGQVSSLAPQTGVHDVLEEATASFSPHLNVSTVSVGGVAQALAAQGHGFALVTEQPTFGLKALPATVGDKVLVCNLYASWDAQHYASNELRMLAHDFGRWMRETKPWSQGFKII